MTESITFACGPQPEFADWILLKAKSIAQCLYVVEATLRYKIPKLGLDFFLVYNVEYG